MQFVAQSTHEEGLLHAEVPVPEVPELLELEPVLWHDVVPMVAPLLSLAVVIFAPVSVAELLQSPKFEE